MRFFLKFFAIVVFMFLVQSCARNTVVDVKSPCVSTEDGPCGTRVPVNKWLVGKA